MNLTNLTIEELEKRILAGGDDAVDCIHAAEKSIQKDGARTGVAQSNDFASAMFMMWRQGEIAICTLHDGALGYYKPWLA